MPDPRYKTIHGLLKEGHITTFTQVFNWIPVSVVAADLGVAPATMRKMAEDPAMWTLGEIYQLAGLIGYDKKKLLMMAGEEGRKIDS